MRPERRAVLAWLRRELERYAGPKWARLPGRWDLPGRDADTAEHGTGPQSFLRREVLRYLHTAQLLGLDTPRGKQALLKGLAAYAGLCESVLRVHGLDVPRPGVPSGRVRRWKWLRRHLPGELTVPAPAPAQRLPGARPGGP